MHSFEPKWDPIDTTNPYALYVVSNWAHDLFHALLKELDTENKYFRLSYVEGPDPEEVNSWTEEYKQKYAVVLEELERRKKQWQQDHMDFYRIQSCLPSSQSYLDKVLPLWEQKRSEMKDMDLVVLSYKWGNQMLKSVPNSALDQFCCDSRPMLNIEHRPQYEGWVKEAMVKLQLPSLNEYLEQKSVKMTQIPKSRLSLNRQKAESGLYYDQFVSLVQEALI